MRRFFDRGDRESGGNGAIAAPDKTLRAIDPLPSRRDRPVSAPTIGKDAGLTRAIAPVFTPFFDRISRHQSRFDPEILKYAKISLLQTKIILNSSKTVTAYTGTGDR
ncbi:hypothetical protein JJD41_08295 [Oxynema sp. CENA135]|uniref:hypothetical protein n=1 Tax=Oxynema sp. CENA135 TaxID=984206 RepID=UPI00190B56A0|nr:hypothetical protein [Oxynema sp. CENA135]MBK4729864.1 hypothetical protein [Oxynema sp. CENA135]